MSAIVDRLRALLVPRWSWNLPSWKTEFLSGLACTVLAFAALVVAAVLLFALTGHWHPPAPVLVFLLATAFGVFYEARIDAKGWDWSDITQRLVGIVAGAFGYAVVLRVLG